MGDVHTRYIELLTGEHTINGIKFLTPVDIWSCQSVHMTCFVAAQTRFLLFKSFLNQLKCQVFRGLSIDTTHTPSPWSFYIYEYL